MTDFTCFSPKIFNICTILMKFVAGQPILKQALPHRPIVQIRRKEILLLSLFLYVLLCSSMCARNYKYHYLIASVSFWQVIQRMNNIARAENVLKMKNSKSFLRKVLTSSFQTSLKDQSFHLN